MSSSTSSSRKVYFKIFLAVTLGMAASLAPIRLFTHSMDAGGDTLMRRVQEARAALPQIVAEEEALVMLFGSSMTEAGFSPLQFDRQVAERGARVKSFNFGFGGLNPYFQDYLSRRVRDVFQENDRRLELALIEFVPFQLTTSRFNGARSVVDSFLTMLASPEEIWQITREDPQRGFQMANIRYLRDNISAEMITFYFGSSLRPPRPRSRLPEDEEAAKVRGELRKEIRTIFEEKFPEVGERDWVYEWQGAKPLAEVWSDSTLETLDDYYEVLRTPRRMENDRFNRIACCDIEKLRFEEILVESFIRMVQNFQQFSNHVEVVLFPRNIEWIKYSPEAAARMAAVLERVKNETGVKIHDDQLLETITPELFRDTTHLAGYTGGVVYTEHLAEEYAPVLVQALQSP